MEDITHHDIQPILKELNEKQLLFNLFLRKWQGNKKQTDDMILLAICPANLKDKISA